MKKLYLLLILLTALVTGQGLQTGLIAYYPFNGNANDESGNGNNGVVHGAVLTQDRFGNNNKAYYFSSLNCGTYIGANINTASIQNALTISFWVSRIGAGCLGPRIMKFYAPSDGPGTVVFNWDNSTNPSVGFVTSSLISTFYSYNNVSNNVWTHLCFTNDGTQAKLYQDGILLSQNPSSGTISLASNASFGRQTNSAYDALNGNLDDIRIYNRALTADEVTELYNLDLPTLQTGLVAYYPFNGNANDESGNGNHATAFYTQNTPDRFGVPNSAFKFNGIDGSTGSTVVTNNTILNIGQSQYTIHFWFKPDNISQITSTLINTNPDRGVGIGFNYETEPGYVAFWVGNASGTWYALNQHGPKNNYQTGVWYSVTLTKIGTQYNFYINGQFEKTTDVPQAASFNYNVKLQISGLNNLSEIFAGDIDDIRIYNRALSSAEVTELYNLETQTVSVTSPNGGENWQVGTSHNITWTSSNVTNVKLEYTTNNGSAWNSIVTSTPAAAGTYSWTVPNTPSTQCKVRVSDASNSLTSDVSNATFTIQVPAGPGWVPISNPQYNMSIIANLYFGNQLTTNGSDILGAFVGNECRGIASPNGTGLIFLSAGSNVQTGDTLTFRAWKSSTQEVRLLPDRIVFQNLGEVGTLINPYRFEDGPGWVPAANQQYNMSIIGQLYFDNILSTNTGDVVGAFVGEECRGVASPGTNGTLFLIVSSNIQTGDTVRFRGWRSSTMATEPISQTLIFQNMAEIGTLINPFRLDAGMRTLAYSFGSGYNWMSVNVNPGSMGVNSLFIPPKITPAPNDRITGQTSFCVWDGTQWLGSLSTIDPKLSYVMKLTTAQVCSLEGLPVTLSPINFGAGYTWGGFYPQSAMPINTALANITPAPTPNDRVISQSAFAVWDGSQWLGSLTTLTPGKGYKFKFTNACVLTYPAGVKTEEIKEPEKVVSAPNWVPLPNLQYNMSIIAKVQIENGPPPVYSTNANDILGAFVVVGVDTQCRGTANPIGSGLYFLTVGSNVQSGENVIFKYFNQENDLIKAIPDVITFQNMGEIGTLVAPQIFNGGPVPVELTSFTGTVNKNKITLTWTTATEKNNKGFEVERKTDKEEFSKISFVEGYGTTTENRSYTFTDKSPASGTNIYRLRQVDYDGSFSYSNEIEVMLELPKEYSLSQNYPNPFNPSTVINYQIPANTYVTLKVFDVIGNEVATLVNQEKPAGYHSVTFEAGKLSSGIYIYQLTAGEMTFTKKLILTK